MGKNIADRVAVISMISFLCSGPIGVGAVVMSGGQQGVIDSVSADVEAAKLKVEKAFLSQGEKSHNKSIKDLGVNFTTSHGNTTIQVSGTFNDGYCIVGTNPESEISEKGISYSYSADGMVSDEQNDCTENLSPAENVTGPVLDQNEINDTDPIEIVSNTFLSAAGSSLAGLVSAGIIAIVEKKRRKKYHSDEDANTAVEESIRESIEPSTTPPEITAIAKSPEEKLRGFTKRLEIVKSEWKEYELDILKVLEYPAVTNMNVPATFEFHKAMRKASHYLAETDSITSDEVKEFGEAILDVEHRFEVMISEAKRLKWNEYTEKERVSLQMAQSLLAIAINSASSPHERQIAYKRLMKEVEGIIVLPEKSIAELEAKISLAIDSMNLREPVVV